MIILRSVRDRVVLNTLLVPSRKGALNKRISTEYTVCNAVSYFHWRNKLQESAKRATSAACRGCLRHYFRVYSGHLVLAGYWNSGDYIPNLTCLHKWKENTNVISLRKRLCFRFWNDVWGMQYSSTWSNLNFETGRRWVVSFTSPQICPQYRLH
jgi:hypothetical protein